MSLFSLAAHSARQSQTTTAGFSGFFEVEVGLPFLEIDGKKEAHFEAHPAPSSALQAVVVIPVAAKDV